MDKVETFKQKTPPPQQPPLQFQQQQLTMSLVENCVTTPISLLFLKIVSIVS